ncbi:MAG TPA: hypothetical protein VG412_10815 [Acidimicrobiales bacterium]|nr:hypothetical protein [Acidimicrobiales bacterium]
MERILRYLMKNGFRRGFRGEHPIWIVVGASAWLLIRARRHGDDVVYRTVLRPGERLVVATRNPGPPESSGD